MNRRKVKLSNDCTKLDNNFFCCVCFYHDKVYVEENLEKKKKIY